MEEIYLNKSDMLSDINQIEFLAEDFGLSGHMSETYGEGSVAMTRFVELFNAFYDAVENYRKKLIDDLCFAKNCLELFEAEESQYAKFFNDCESGKSPFGELSGVHFDLGGTP